ncbi:MAG TPA: hypothetical protein P5181_01315 [Dermatophilaceae bacterium]|nr:hypothetical protein [Dermatophilaceae bacterium]
MIPEDWRDPTQALAQLELLTGQGRLLEAREVALVALDAAPGHLRLLCVAASLELELGEPEAALDLAQRAAIADPTSDVPHRIIADGLLAVARPEMACYAAYRTVELDPGDWRNHVCLSRCLATLPETNEQAWEAARQAVRLAPDEPSTHVQVAAVAFPSGAYYADEAHLHLAERALREAVRLDPRDPALRMELARVLTAQGHPVQALTDFAAMVREDPTGSGPVGVAHGRHLLSGLLQQVSAAVLFAAIPPVLGMGSMVTAVAALAAIGYAAWQARRVWRHGGAARRLLTGSWALQAASVLCVAGLGLLVGAMLSAEETARTAGAGAWLCAVGAFGVLWLASWARGSRA